MPELSDRDCLQVHEDHVIWNARLATRVRDKIRSVCLLSLKCLSEVTNSYH